MGGCAPKFMSKGIKKPPETHGFQGVQFLSLHLNYWRLCPATMPKRHQAVLSSTKTRVQKPVPVIPTRLRKSSIAVKCVHMAPDCSLSSCFVRIIPESAGDSVLDGMVE